MRYHAHQALSALAACLATLVLVAASSAPLVTVVGTAA